MRVNMEAFRLFLVQVISAAYGWFPSIPQGLSVVPWRNVLDAVPCRLDKISFQALRCQNFDTVKLTQFLAMPTIDHDIRRRASLAKIIIDAQRILRGGHGVWIRSFGSQRTGGISNDGCCKNSMPA